MKRSFEGFFVWSSVAFLAFLAGCATPSRQNEVPIGSLDGCSGFAVEEDDFKSDYHTLSVAQWEDIFDSFITDGLRGEPEFEEKLQYLIQHPRHMARILKNAEPYIYCIYREAIKTGLPSEILIVPMIESMYRTDARSPSGYVGLWQFGAQTARNFGMRVDKTVDERTDFRKSSASAIGYLAYLNKFFNGNWQLAIAGYNAGEGTIQRAIKNLSGPVAKIDFRKVNMPVHTRKYLFSIYAYAYYLKHYKQYKVVLPKKKNSTGAKYGSNLSKIKYVSKEEFANLNDLSLDQLEKMDLIVRRKHKGKETLCEVYLPSNTDDSYKTDVAKNVDVSEMGQFSKLEKDVVNVVKNVDPVKTQRLKPKGLRGRKLEQYVVQESIYDEDAYFKSLQRMIEEDLSIN